MRETVEKLGGLDIIVANAGWTKFSDFKDLHALSHDDWNKVNKNTLSFLLSITWSHLVPISMYLAWKEKPP